MTTRVILLLTYVLFVLNASAQTHYSETKTFHEDGYTYQCDLPNYGLITLYNKENLYTKELTYYYKDGSKVDDMEILHGRKQLVEDDNWTQKTCFSIVNNAFSEEEKIRLRENKIDISMIIDPSSGKVTEVSFSFFYDDPFATIPVSTYRKIELELKSKVWFTATETGKGLKFITLGWDQKVEDVIP